MTLSQLPDAISQAFANPQQKHAMLVHLPVAISLLGVIMLLVLTGLRGRSHPVRWLTAGMYLIAAITSFLAKQSGFEASLMVDVLSPEYIAQLNHHKQLAENLPLAMFIQSILIAFTALSIKKIRITMLILSFIMSLWLALWVAQTAHHGGSLVYVHGAAARTMMIKPPAHTPPPAARVAKAVAVIPVRS